MRASRVPSRSGFFVVVVALAATLVLGAAPSAQAANIVPNPGFEANCSGIPCNWSSGGAPNLTIAHDTVNPHPPSTASIMATVSSNAAAGPVGDCVSMALAAASYSASFWYRTTNPNITLAPTLSGLGYTSSNACSGPAISISNLQAPSTITDGQWHQVSGAATFSSAVQSVRFQVFFQCASACFPGNPLATATVNFDDVVVDTADLAVTVTSLKAVRSRKGVVVRWRTGTEYDQLGFNVYRQQANRRVRVNRRILPAFGGFSGASYSFRDRRAPKRRALRYWLQDVDARGHRTWHGPVRVGAS